MLWIRGAMNMSGENVCLAVHARMCVCVCAIRLATF